MAGNVDLIGSVPLFAKLPPKTVERIDQLTVEREFPAGAEIVVEGEGGVGFFLIASGRAEVLQKGDSGPRGTLSRGDAFGEMALLDGGPRSATVRALEATRCLVLTRWHFLAEVRTNPDLAIELLETLSLRIRDLEARLDEQAARVRV
jgi:CRP-like cAMP-binding protein